MDIKEIEDISTESRVVGSFYKDPNLFMEYDDLIFAEWDFVNDDLRFLYNLVREIWYTGQTRIDETTVNIEVNKDPEKLDRYKKIKGYSTVQKLISKTNIDDFPAYFTELKKYNLLRELDRKGFPIRKKWDKIIKLSPDAIYKYFDYSLTKTFTHFQGLAGSTILGRDMTSVYEKWKVEPDVGIEIPYFIMNNIIRGWRTGKLNSTGMHSGCGKSRYMSLMTLYIGVYLQIPLLLIVNEQDIDEWQAMLLTACVNNIFAPKTGVYIDEDIILTGQCTPEQDKACKRAAKYIEERSKIHFQEAQVYDYATLRRILKVHKLKGVNYFIYDTFKPFRGEHGVSWEGFVKTSEDLKRACLSKNKGGLEMGGWITFQLTDDSQFDQILTSTSVASGKQIKHNLDMMSMARPLSFSEKKKIKVKVFQKNNPIGGIMDLDPFRDYYIMFCDKNRGGKDKQKIILEVDKGKLLFKELGFAIFKTKEDEMKAENREAH